MDLFVIISEKLYCSRLNRCGQFEKSEKKYVYFENIQIFGFKYRKKKNYREIDYEEKNYFFFI